MAAIGLLRAAARDRPAGRAARVAGTRLRALSIAFGVAAAVALVATPSTLLLATAKFALRSFCDVGALVPLLRASVVRPRLPRPRADVRAVRRSPRCVALWVDRPDATQRSIAELLAFGGARSPRGAVLLVPGVAGTRRRRRRARWSLALRLVAPVAPARSGSAAWSACSCSGRACPPRGGSPGSSSRCRASRTSRSCP